jgi:hypothetical protein
MSDKPAGTTSENWILDHVLMVQTLLSLAYFGWLMSFIDPGAPDPLASFQPENLSPLIVLVGTFCTIAALVFWVRMFTDFFKCRPDTHRALWGWFLLLGGHLAALVYFWVIWRRRVMAQAAHP